MAWYKFGFGEHFGPSNPDLHFTLDFTNAHPNLKEGAVLDIAINSVQSIIEKYPPPFNLMVSGGVDSQAMIYAWFRAGANFKIISFRYTGSDGQIFNAHDLENLELFAEQYNLDVDYRDINIIDFLEDDLPVLADTIQCTSPQICAHAMLANTIKDGTIIFSGNALYKSATMYNYTVFWASKICRN